MPTKKSKTLPTWQCMRCNHLWFPRVETVPVRCPKCKSQYWNTPRRKK